MNDATTIEHGDDRGRGAEHPDLVLRGEEEHPLLSRLFNLKVLVDDRGDAA